MPRFWEWATNQSIDQSIGRPPLCERLRVQLRREDGEREREREIVCQSRQEFWQDFANLRSDQRLNLVKVKVTR